MQEIILEKKSKFICSITKAGGEKISFNKAVEWCEVAYGGHRSNDVHIQAYLI